MGKIKIVSASAGSGKTYNLAYEYVRNVINDPSLYRHILAVTFTNKATEEMKQRILSKINELATGKSKDFIDDLRRDLNLPDNIIEQRAKEARSKILHDYNRFAVLTIDKFFQRIIRSFIKELGIDINFNLELPTETLLSGATDRLIDESAQDDSLRAWLTAFVNERMDDNKQWNIRQEIESLGAEVFKEYFRMGGINISRNDIDILVKNAVKESENAKNNIFSKARSAAGFLERHGLTVDDFTQKTKGVGGFIFKNSQEELTAPNSYVDKALDNDAWIPAKSDKRGSIDSIATGLHRMVADLREAYINGIPKINTALLLKRNYRSFALLSDLKERIDRLSVEENIVHISEINSMLSLLIADNDTPFIFEKAGNYYSHYMIDEFQDTSTLQWNNFIPLLKNATSQSEETPVILVGDVKQSIYRWRGGDWKILAQDAPDKFEDRVSLSLQKNYRSSRTVVDFNNAIIGAVVASDDANINRIVNTAAANGTISGTLSDSLTGLAAAAYADYIQESDKKDNGGYATVTYYPKDAEGRSVPPVIERIEELQRRGYRANEIAILVRTNTQATEIANMLLEHKGENPDSEYCYDVISQDALVIGKSPVCRFVIACLTLSMNTSDSINRAIYNRRISKPFGEQLSAEDMDFFQGVRLLSLEEAFETIAIRYSLGRDSRETAYLQALHEQMISFISTNIADIPLFVQWWNDTGSAKSISMPSGGNAISIETIHRSKGLGYRVVILPYCNWTMNAKADSVVWATSGKAQEPVAANGINPVGAFPIGFSKDMADSAFAEDYYREYVLSHIDNLNLFYVAVTRAKDELHIMLPDPPKTSTSETIARLISGNIAVNGDKAMINNFEGTVSTTPNGITLFEFGKADTAKAQPDEQKAELIEIEFRSNLVNERVKISVPSRRYLEDGAGDGRLTPRDYGILMHRVFEYAAHEQDINRNLKKLVEDGGISSEESELLAGKIGEAFRDNRIKEWFSDKWDEIRNENDILVPGENTYRPDRVMIHGKRAVVVDYKFGLQDNPKYSEQLSNYIGVLNRMGYLAEGYIWYVSLNRIVAV